MVKGISGAFDSFTNPPVFTLLARMIFIFFLSRISPLRTLFSNHMAMCLTHLAPHVGSLRLSIESECALGQAYRGFGAGKDSRRLLFNRFAR